MSMALLPGLLGLTAGRSFSFYPPVLGVAHNEWRFRRANWSEFVVVNTGTGEEACIPRSFVSDVSANAPTVIVGLRRDLELRDGMVIPYRRPVVEMPLAVNDFVPAGRSARPAPVVSIRLESRPPLRTGRKAVVLVMFGMVAAVMAGGVLGPGEFRNRIDAMRVSRTWQQLKPTDSYTDVIDKLGRPAAQRTHTEPGGRVFRALDYPDRHFTVVLEGQTESEGRYLASIDARGRTLGDAKVSGTGKLRFIPRF